MSNDEALQTYLIFGALTRPAMTAGVTLEYHGLNLMVSICAFIAMNNLFYGALFLPLHVFGWLVCRHEPRFFGILAKRMKLPQVPNALLWGVRCYEPY